MVFDKKAFRLLILFDRLIRGEVIHRQNTAEEFDVSVKSIQRDISDLNYYLASTLQSDVEIVLSRKLGGYRLNNPLETRLSKEETLSLMKIVLESRAFSKSDMCLIFDKLMNSLAYEDKRLLNNFYGNEKNHYIETKNSKSLFKILWDMSLAIKENRIVRASYRRVIDELPKDIVIEPVGIMFSEYYFYLLAHYHDRDYTNPAIFRLDNFEDYIVTDNRFTRHYMDRFEEGQFRKRVQFMNIGELMTVEFEFWGRSLDAVTDRLPTAKIIGSNGNRTILRAEVYGKGIKMWLLSQGEFLRVTHPPEFVDEMKQTIAQMMENYT